MNAILAPLIPLQVCPVAPPGAQQYADQIAGYVLWGVGILFVVGTVIAIGAIIAGRIFSMPHASKAGIVSIFVAILSGIAYMVVPSIVASILGSGCI